jgi:hypothetical protein
LIVDSEKDRKRGKGRKFWKMTKRGRLKMTTCSGLDSATDMNDRLRDGQTLKTKGNWGMCKTKGRTFVRMDLLSVVDDGYYNKKYYVMVDCCIYKMMCLKG